MLVIGVVLTGLNILPLFLGYRHRSQILVWNQSYLVRFEPGTGLASVARLSTGKIRWEPILEQNDVEFIPDK